MILNQDLEEPSRKQNCAIFKIIELYLFLNILILIEPNLLYRSSSLKYIASQYLADSSVTQVEFVYECFLNPFIIDN